MKKIPKAKLDRCIELNRRYFDVMSPFDDDLLNEKIDVGNKLELEVKVGIMILSNLLSSIMAYSGLKPDATNEDIYKVLEVLGWEVE